MEYRVYDKKRKKFVNDEIYLNPNGELLKPNKSFLGWTKPTFVSENRYVYQKSIGLSDMNNKEIYVGDYVKAQVADDREIIGLVTFAEEISSYIILCFETDEFFTLGSEVSKFIKVIGNVFNEPKEMKGKKK